MALELILAFIIAVLVFAALFFGVFEMIGRYGDWARERSKTNDRNEIDSDNPQ